MAKCIMFKQAYKLGEDIIGIMDFSEETVPCVQVCTALNPLLHRLFLDHDIIFYFHATLKKIKKNLS